MHASLLSSRTALAQTPVSDRHASAPRTARRTAVTPRAMSFYDLSAKTIDGDDLPFSTFKGKPVLIVNVASK